jgi:hypothetical protein
MKRGTSENARSCCSGLSGSENRRGKEQEMKTGTLLLCWLAAASILLPVCPGHGEATALKRDVTQSFPKKRNMSKAEAVTVLTKWFAFVRPPLDQISNASPMFRQMVHSVNDTGYSRKVLKPVTDSTSRSFVGSNGRQTIWENRTTYHYETLRDDRIAFSRISRIEIWASPKVINLQGVPVFSVRLEDDSGAAIDQIQDVINDPTPATDVLSALLTLCPKVK